MQDTDKNELLREAASRLTAAVDKLDQQANGPTHSRFESLRETCRKAVLTLEACNVRLGKSKAPV